MSSKIVSTRLAIVFQVIFLMILSIGCAACDGSYYFRIDATSKKPGFTKDDIERMKSYLEKKSNEYEIEVVESDLNEFFILYGKIGFTLGCRVWNDNQIISCETSLVGPLFEPDYYKALNADLLNAMKNDYKYDQIMITDRNGKNWKYYNEIFVTLPDGSYIDQGEFSPGAWNQVQMAINSLDDIAIKYQLLKLKGTMNKYVTGCLYYYVGGDSLGLHNLEKSIVIKMISCSLRNKLIICIYDFKQKGGVVDAISSDVYDAMASVFGKSRVVGRRMDQ